MATHIQTHTSDPQPPFSRPRGFQRAFGQARGNQIPMLFSGLKMAALLGGGGVCVFIHKLSTSVNMINPLRQKRLSGCGKHQMQFSQITHLETRARCRKLLWEHNSLFPIFHFLSDEHNSNNRVRRGLKWPHLMND